MPNPAGKIKSTPARPEWDEDNCEVNFGTYDNGKPRSLGRGDVEKFLEEAGLGSVQKLPLPAIVQKVNFKNAGNFQIPIGSFTQKLNDKFRDIAETLQEITGTLQEIPGTLKQSADSLSSPATGEAPAQAPVKKFSQARTLLFKEVRKKLYELRGIDPDTQNPAVTEARDALLTKLINYRGNGTVSCRGQDTDRLAIQKERLLKAYQQLPASQKIATDEALVAQDLRFMQSAYSAIHPRKADPPAHG